MNEEKRTGMVSAESPRPSVSTGAPPFRQGGQGGAERTPEIIGAEIRMFVDAGRRVTLLCGIEIGRRLCEAKDMLAHGEWLPWLSRETDFGERKAQLYMQAFREYGADQMWIFGPETNTKTFADLPISKALALLSVPESEREDFAAQVDAEHLSTRELQQAVRERDEAAIEEAARLARAKAEAEAAERLAALQKKLDAAEKKAEKAEKAAQKAKADAEKAGQGDKEELARAAREAEEARREAEELRKQLKLADPTATEFKAYFEQLQQIWNALSGVIGRAEPELGEKLKKAARALLEKFGEALG